MTIRKLCGAVFLSLTWFGFAADPPSRVFPENALPLGAGNELPNEGFGLHFDFLLEDPIGPAPTFELAPGVTLCLSGELTEPGIAQQTAAIPEGKWQRMQVAYRKQGEHGLLSTWLNGEPIHERVVLSPRSETVFSAEDVQACDWQDDHTAIIRFRSAGGGTLIEGESKNGEGVVLGLSERQLSLQIKTRTGAAAVGSEIDAAEDWSTVALRSEGGGTSLIINGQLAASSNAPFTEDFSSLKLGSWKGEIGSFQFFPSALSDQDLALTLASEPIERVKPTLSWEPDDEEALSLKLPDEGVSLANVWIQPLSDVDHAGLLVSLDDEAVKRGARIYEGLCFSCHGNDKQAGSLPTSRPFWNAPFLNGADPYGLFNTVKNGFQQMPPQPWLTPEQIYDVVHYIREELVKPNNPSQYTAVDDDYLMGLPLSLGTGSTLTDEQAEYAQGPKYLRMNFGPSMGLTLEAEPGNIAYKGIAVRLDEGPGGISKGKAWMLYDHDTMRVAAAWEGEGFIDWQGIAFDQSHGSHASIVGDKAWVNPVGPGWANPENGSWEDIRFRGRDGKPYGPLPREWAQFLGQFFYGNRVVLKYTVGDALVLESPSLELSNLAPVFSRTLNVGSSSRDLTLRVAPESTLVSLAGGSSVKLEQADGFHIVRIPARREAVDFKVLLTKDRPEALHIASLTSSSAEDLSAFTSGSSGRWPQEVVTEVAKGEGTEAFEVDDLTLPFDNPWESWMRLGAFDFFEDGNRAVVATWLGDIWVVEGLSEGSDLRWRRIATGLFQPLGLKVVDEQIFVTCRDQLARLHDLNGDGEIDFIECFNNDHQVTEHFHEFAMGLQTDDEGNFYYAKSARHALPALVAHHGTLLRVSRDGSKTEILATGFRAANGVCLNPDGSFIVTDQEGHWNPKNRINEVRPGGFYGNMMGYHEVTDVSDEAMESPLCWITNEFDRSPAELLWVPQDAGWGALNGQLLNLSYGMGAIFVVPHERIGEQVQGGMVNLGLDFPTGIMRGRFHPEDGQLYVAGMFAWAGNKVKDGGFYRVRYTGKPSWTPIGLKAFTSGIEVTFTDALDRESTAHLENYAVSVWGLKRSENYGSPHVDEHELAVTAVRLSEDAKTLFLEIPEIVPTWCMKITIRGKGSSGGESFERILHNTVHQLR